MLSREGGVPEKDEGVLLRLDALYFASPGLDPYSSHDRKPVSLGDPETEPLQLEGLCTAEVEVEPFTLVEERLSGLIGDERE